MAGLHDKMRTCSALIKVTFSYVSLKNRSSGINTQISICYLSHTGTWTQDGKEFHPDRIKQIPEDAKKHTTQMKQVQRFSFLIKLHSCT